MALNTGVVYVRLSIMGPEFEKEMTKIVYTTMAHAEAQLPTVFMVGCW